MQGAAATIGTVWLKSPRSSSPILRLHHAAFSMHRNRSKCTACVYDLQGVGIKEKDALGRTALQYACNETVVNYLEAALNQILIYRDCFEINMQSEVKRGAEGTVGCRLSCGAAAAALALKYA